MRRRMGAALVFVAILVSAALMVETTSRDGAARDDQIVRQHRRVQFASFYNGTPGRAYDLRRKPRSLAAYRRFIVPLGR